MSLFKKATEKAEKGTKAKAKRESFKLDATIGTDIVRLASINEQIAKLQGEAAELQTTIRTSAIDKLAEVYESTGKFPGSMLMESGNGSFMFIPTDKYISIDKDAAEALRKEVSEDLVDEKTTYTMNTALVEKYGEIISELIENCEEISEKDKEDLISATVKYEVKKGTIQDLTKYSTHSIKDMLEIIRPVYQVKNIKDKTQDISE